MKRRSACVASLTDRLRSAFGACSLRLGSIAMAILQSSGSPRAPDLHPQYCDENPPQARKYVAPWRRETPHYAYLKGVKAPRFEKLFNDVCCSLPNGRARG